MSLTSALYNSLSGLRTAQAGIDVVARNLSNATTPGYTKKTAPQESVYLNGEVAGVRTLAITREIDLTVQRELRVERSSSANLAVIDEYLTELNQLFGRPDEEVSFAASVNRLGTSLAALADTPESATARLSVLNAADNVARDLNRMSETVQQMRQEAEDGIADSVAEINEALTGIEELNGEIAVRARTGKSTADLEDQRDKLVDQIAEHMDIRTFTRGGGNEMVIMTASGRTLLDVEARTLAFDRHGPLSAQTAYSTDPAERGVGTITLLDPEGTSYDLLEFDEIRSGKIAGYLELRDEILPQTQAQLDELAHNLAVALAGGEIAGTPVTRVTDSAGVSNAAYPFDADYATPGSLSTLTITVDGVAHTVDDIATFAGTDPDGPDEAVRKAIQAALDDAGLGDITVSVNTVGANYSLSFADAQARTISDVSLTDGASTINPALTPQYETTSIDVTEVHTPGDTLTLTYGDATTGEPQTLTLRVVSPPANGPDEIVAGASPETTAATMQTALSTLLPPGITVVRSGATLELRDTDMAVNSTKLVGLTATSQTAVGPQLSLFADGNGTDQRAYTALPGLGADDQKLGFAQRISVSEGLLADPGGLVRFQQADGTLSDDGDPSRPLALLDRLTSDIWSFDGNLGLGTLNTTIENFAATIVSYQAGQAADVTDRHDYQMAITESLERRFDSVSGVNVDEEMAEMLLLQQSFNASSQVLSAIQAMFDELLAAVR